MNPIHDTLSPQRKWAAITLATIVLVPACWSLVAALVATAPGRADGGGAPNAALALALGLALVPFVFVVLAFMTARLGAPGAVLKAMGLALLVGIPVSALAGDAVTGIVAGVGAGAIVALRAEAAHNWRARAVAVLAASLYTFALVHAAGAFALLAAPVLPLTGIGVADHLSEWRRDREAGH
jgi:hypothetical protein